MSSQMARHCIQICVYLLINSITSEETEGQDERIEDFSDQDDLKLHEELHYSEIIDIRLTENQTKIFQEMLGKKIASSNEILARAIAGGGQVRLEFESK